MYQLRTKNCPKRDIEKRWALPGRVFFACGACQILAHVFMEKFASMNTQALWIKPDDGHTGNHIIVAFEGMVFDYHGYSEAERYLAHYWKRARRIYPTWNGKMVEITPEALITEGPSTIYDGLWLRAPHQFFQNPIPRAERYLAKFPKPSTFVGR